MSVIEKLLAVQEHDCKIRDIKKEMKDIPARKKAEETRLDACKQALAEAEENLKQKQAAVQKVELEIAANREKIDKFRSQQLEIKTNKEFKAMDNEIAGVEKKISEFEDDQLVAMEDVDRAKALLDERKEELNKENDAIQQDIGRLDERLNRIQAMLDECQKERDAAAVDVDPEWLKVYYPIFQRKNLALVPLNGGVCGGCHMAVPRQVVHNAKKHLNMVTCDFCGRLLY